MIKEDVEVYKRALERERKARKAAEKILEEKSSELFSLSNELKKSNERLTELLGEQNSELQGLFKHLVDAYIVFDFDGKVLRMNDAASQLLGQELKDAPLYVNSIVVLEDKYKTVVAFNHLRKKGKIEGLVLRIDIPGGRRLVKVNAGVIKDNNGNPIAGQGIFRDITEEQQAKPYLQESKKRLKTLIVNLQAGVLLEDETRKIALTNKMFCDIFSIPVKPEKLRGMDCSSTADQVKHLFKDPEDFEKRIKQLVHDKKTALGDELHMTDGRILERDYIPIFINGDYKGHLWSYTDISIKKKFEYVLKVQKQKYSSIIEDMNLGLVEMDQEYNIQWANSTFSEITEFANDDLVNSTILDICDREMLERPLANPALTTRELDIKTKSGVLKTFLFSETANRDLNGALKGRIGIFLDVTQFKALQKEKGRLLENLEKSNQELSEYAHIVSHDLKSPLRSLQALISWVREDDGDKLSGESLENFKNMDATLEKMDGLISGILNYSNIQRGNRKDIPVNINTVIDNIRETIFLPTHIKIVIKNKLPTMQVDKTRIEQLFQNLISNAVDHIDKEEGLIEIDCVEESERYVFSVRDNGMGIAQVYHKKIFKIFQSLSTHKNSTGLGLSIVKKIVEMYQGTIWLESEVGKGTKFYFSIQKL